MEEASKKFDGKLVRRDIQMRYCVQNYIGLKAIGRFIVRKLHDLIKKHSRGAKVNTWIIS